MIEVHLKKAWGTDQTSRYDETWNTSSLRPMTHILGTIWMNHKFFPNGETPERIVVRIEPAE